MPSDDTIAALRLCRLFTDLSEADLEDLVAQGVRRRFGRGELIFNEGDEGDGMYVVLSGRVDVSRQDAEGAELVLAVRERGDHFGELALFDGQPRSATVTSVSEAELLFLPRAGFREFLERRPSAVFRMLEAVIRQLRDLTELADDIALLDIRRRLARRLLYLAEKGLISGTDARGRERHGTRITQQQLAAMLGATRESVNKHLNALVDGGVIRLDRGEIKVLDPARLRTISEGRA